MTKFLITVLILANLFLLFPVVVKLPKQKRLPKLNPKAKEPMNMQTQIQPHSPTNK